MLHEEIHIHTECTHTVDRRRFCVFVQKTLNSGRGVLRRSKKRIFFIRVVARDKAISRVLFCSFYADDALPCARSALLLSLSLRRDEEGEKRSSFPRKRERERLARAFCVKSLLCVVCSAR